MRLRIKDALANEKLFDNSVLIIRTTLPEPFSLGFVASHL